MVKMTSYLFVWLPFKSSVGNCLGIILLSDLQTWSSTPREDTLGRALLSYRRPSDAWPPPPPPRF